MKKIFFIFVVACGLLGGVSLHAASNTVSTMCGNNVGAGCVEGACPSGTTAITATCSNNRTCCQNNANISGGEDTLDTEGSSTLGGTSAVSFNLANPLKYDSVEGALTNIMGAIRGLVVTLALLMIVIGGVMYIISFGNADSMKKAKSIVLAALIGLAIVIAAPAFLKEIAILLGWDTASAIEGGTNLTLTQIAVKVLNFLLSIIGTLAIIMMIISGIMYLSSAGNDGRMKQAKGIFMASLIGIAVALASMVLVTAVARFFE